MNNNWQKDYPLISDSLVEADVGENSGLKMLPLVGENKRVIDFGCATGSFAQLLTEQGCQVTGVEINQKAAKEAEQYCEQVIVADLDFVSLSEILPKQAFDVAVFGDVLEHLRDPWKVLEETRQLLKSEGCVIASIPNIAHGAIRLALLQGRFEYTEMGILDNTHLRFFTRKTVEELFERSGYFVDVINRTKRAIFSKSNLIPSINKDSFDSKLIDQIEQDKDADTLQFIIRAFPISLDKHIELQEKYSQMLQQLENAKSQITQIYTDLEKAETQTQDKQTQLEQTQFQLEITQAELERAQVQAQQIQVELKLAQSQQQETQAALDVVEAKQQDIQAELQAAQTTIAKMQQSKFWKLRTAWVNLKKIMGY